ncbi:SusC/RagA family TonB-linked outer membrane protein [Persicitalea jodogahamensis]|uniref:SusC/RagA family TonB-linked outer membrane protein n=1 Tax=Persicitalea jodogahamensis TaxID=402147 RepID=A0A8J3GBS3_9BACT|nr:TonB-dependent receptor [Persicitalea jodogahamensis]GHB79744.1 SusC/RagA family TonB-linked outer membrane protein [Persicitalea jodogahamensis]
MHKIPIPARSLGLALLVTSQMSLAGFSQTLAFVPQSRPVASAPVTTHLRTVLLELQDRYNVELIFEDRLVAKRTVNMRAVDYSQSVERNLDRILQPVNLKVKEVRKNTFVITESGKFFPGSSQTSQDKADARTTNENSSTGPALVNYPSITMLEKAEESPKRIVRGTVTDENNAGLPGVSVVVKGTTRGTTTNNEGNFELDVLEPNPTLVFSFVGFVTQEILLGNQSELEIRLAVDDKSLDEVVVVGYGVQRKSDLTGAVGAVKGETLRERPVASLNQALSGRITGVNVSTNSGRPGGRANIRIRGNTSVSVANNPLYVIDGVILNATDLANGSTPIDFINPNDIASVEVLKDASATAIYGARGANGVILVTTKRGSDGGRVSYDTEFSVGVLPKKIPLLNSEEFLLAEDIAYQNAQKYDPVGWAGGKFTDPKTKRTDPLLFDANGKPLYDTDWQDEAFRRAKTQNHQLAFSGGNSKDNFGLYLGYRNEEGLMKESFLKRYSGRFTMDSQIKKWLKVGGSLGYNDQNENQVDPLGGGGIIPMRQVLEELPIIPVKYPDGRWGSNENYPGMEGGGSPIQVITERIYLVKTQTMLGSVYTNINLAKGLELRTTLGTNIINQRIDYYGGRTLNYISRNQGGDASINNARHNSWQFENYLTYNTRIANIHSFNALLGVAWQHVDRFTSQAQAQRFQDDYFQFNNLGAGAVAVAPSSSTSAYGLNSYFGRFNYGLKDRYLLTFTGRIDGSSKFGSANQYALFPSAALAWRVTEEDFMKSIPAISNLKVRTSIGSTGNSEITAYQALAGLGNYSVIFNGARQVGIGVNRLANPDLRWEKTLQTDAGVELGLFNNRITLEADVYRKLTTNMLLSAPVPSSSGFTNVSQNVGSMVNQGVEFAINTVNIATPKFTWNSTFNISVNRNRVKALTGGADIFTGSTIIREGEPVGSFFGFVHLGTWNTSEESEAAKYLKKPGDIKYQDTNGDGKINDNDRVVIGKGIPDGFGTFLNTLSYGNLELTVDLQFMYGNDVLFRSKHSAEDRVGIANSFKTVLNGWTPENQDTPLAQLRPVSAGYNTNNDTYRVQDGSFLRGRNLLLAYRFPNTVLDKLHLNRLRAFVSVQNFFLSTKFQGYDPEVSTSGAAFDQGVDLYAYPKPRVFMVGLNIGL